MTTTDKLLRLCVCCRNVRVTAPEDEICPWCWNRRLERANQRRRQRIAAGWTVDATGTIHPPNVCHHARRG